MKRIRFTKEGYEKQKAEYEKLLAERPTAVKELSKARDMGDLSENGYYKASKARLSFIDGQLRKLSYEIKYAMIIDSNLKDIVDIGSKVILSDGTKEVTYHVVGDLEANPSQGKISLLSPLGQAIANKKQGEEVLFEIPRGKIMYKIISIS